MAKPEDERIEDDEKDDSSSDEDFNPEVQANEDEDSVSSSEDEQPQPATSRAKKGNKRKRADQKIPEVELDSGDEATIQEKKKSRKKGADADFLSDDEGGEAGFIKTRSQRQKEHLERRPLANTLGATIDVEAVWARLSAVQVGRPPPSIPQAEESPSKIQTKPAESEEDYITIKRTIKFAGEVTTEAKRVHKHSAEARLYLKEQEDEKRKASEKEDVEMVSAPEEPSKPALRRPLKRPSRFEPNPTGEVKSLPPNLQLRWPRDKYVAPTVAGATDPKGNTRMPPPLAPATKLNTVEKSRYDWAGYVDKEGIAEELDEYGKSKENYMGRKEFLNRTENRREDELRDRRMKGK